MVKMFMSLEASCIPVDKGSCGKLRGRGRLVVQLDRTNDMLYLYEHPWGDYSRFLAVLTPLF